MLPLQSTVDQFWALVEYFAAYVGLGVLLIVIGVIVALILRLRNG